MAQGNIASGTGAFIGIAPQPTWTATSVTRTKFLPVVSFSGGLEQEIQSRNDLTTSASERGYWKTGKLTKFTTVHLLDFGGYEQILKRIFGASASALHSGGTLAYDHLFTLANARIMATVERCLDSALATPKTPSLVCPAAIITAAEFEFNLFDPIKLTLEWLGRDEDALAVASTPTFPADNLIVPCLGGTGGTFTIATTPYAITKGKVRIEDPHATGQFHIGLTRTASKPAREAKRVVTGEFTTEFDDTDGPTLYALYAGLTESKLTFDYQSTAIEATTNYQFQLVVNRTVPTGKTPEVSGPGPVELTIPFKGYYDVTNVKDAVDLTLINATAYTASPGIL